MKNKGYEYKTKNNRLQMSLFSMLYHRSGGFLNTPSYVFKNIKNTEWGKLKNFPEVMRTIKDAYYKEANITLDNVVTYVEGTPSNDYKSFMPVKGGLDTLPVDIRFGETNGKTNHKMKMAYREFVFDVMSSLGLEPKRGFGYFELKHHEK